jgi:hypothetical protein
VLILAGSLVPSPRRGPVGSRLATSYGWNMLTCPRSMWVANIFYTRIACSRRVSASSRLCSPLAMDAREATKAALARRRGPPCRGQRLLGGITVLFHLAPAVSTAHAGLAESSSA